MADGQDETWLKQHPNFEYYYSGGRMDWAPSHVRAAFSTLLNNMRRRADRGKRAELADAGRNETPNSRNYAEATAFAEEALRPIIRGGRAYIKSDAVARAAGYEPLFTYTDDTNRPRLTKESLSVERGHVFIDPNSKQMYFNSHDWHELADGHRANNTKHGVAEILGGADADDSVVWVPFIDKTSGEQMALIYRNPNAYGERVVMPLSKKYSSVELTWETVDGPKPLPVLDKNVLTPRRDEREAAQQGDTYHVQYATSPEEGAIRKREKHDHAPPGASFNDATASAMDQAATNAGVIGYISYNLDVTKWATGREHNQMPARLEEIIDLVKTGDDGGPVKEWTVVQNNKMAIMQTPIPDPLKHKVITGKNQTVTRAAIELLHDGRIPPQLLNPEWAAKKGVDLTQAEHRKRIAQLLSEGHTSILHDRFTRKQRGDKTTLYAPKIITTSQAGQPHTLTEQKAYYAQKSHELFEARETLANAALPPKALIQAVSQNREAARISPDTTLDWYEQGADLIAKTQTYRKRLEKRYTNIADARQRRDLIDDGVREFAENELKNGR
ncbi:MAG: hypothetical protein AAF125_17535 [Chloroflexota bacterium]